MTELFQKKEGQLKDKWLLDKLIRKEFNLAKRKGREIA